jgi:TRAP-type uncharacterized transport system substrate-binding protein
VRTVATVAVLLAGAPPSDSEVASLTRLVFDTKRELAALGSTQGAQVSAATALRGLAIPLHTGALKALEHIRAGAKR